MAQPVLNALNSSAIVNTMLGSESVRNEQIYNTKEINPPHSLTYSSMLPVTGSSISGPSQTSTFQVSKYGYIAQMLLKFTKTYTQTGTGTSSTGTASPINDVFATLERVQLLSSSRVISQLTRFDLMAQFSNLPEDKLYPIRESCLAERSIGQLTQNQTKSFDYVVPLHWSFMNSPELQLDSNFLEPLEVKCIWGDQLAVETGNSGANVTFTASISDISLLNRYKVYMEDQNARILSENYDKPQLNILSSRYEDEVRSQQIIASNTSIPAKISVELKNTEAVQNFYVICLVSDPGTSATTAGVLTDYKPHAITNIRFTASGQEICNLSDKDLAYAKVSEDGWAWGASDTSSTGSRLVNVAKFQTGTWGAYKLSNCFSLRNINAPTIEVSFNTIAGSTNGREYSVYVVEDCSTIFSISSQTGSVAVALSN